MTVIERKVLGALIGAMDDEQNVLLTRKELTRRMGYASDGGVINLAIQALEMKNKIVIVRPAPKQGAQTWYKVLI